MDHIQLFLQWVLIGIAVVVGLGAVLLIVRSLKAVVVLALLFCMGVVIYLITIVASIPTF